MLVYTLSQFLYVDALDAVDNCAQFFGEDTSPPFHFLIFSSEQLVET